MIRYRRPVDDTYDSDTSFSPEEDELFDVDEDQSDDSTEPTDTEDLGEDVEGVEDIDFDDKLLAVIRTHRSTTGRGWKTPKTASPMAETTVSGARRCSRKSKGCGSSTWPCRPSSPPFLSCADSSVDC